MPEDIAITGFDDVLIARALEITTIRQPVVMLGRLVAEQLLDQKELDNQKKIILEMELMIRKLT